MSKKGNLIFSGKECPYCNKETEFIDSKEVYRESYGMIYICRPCKSWVGVHKETTISLGRLANAELRAQKRNAHEYFDKLWASKIKKGYKKGRARLMVYKWLSTQLGIPKEETHIGWFDIPMCKKVVEICKPHVDRLSL